MANEIQKITPSAVPSGGSWKIVYDGSASTSIASGADATAVQAAAEGIAAIGSGNVSVTGNESSGFTFEFVGSLANTNMLTLSYQDNTLTIAGSATFGTTQEGGGGQNEIQTIVINADGGTFTISIPGQGTTGTLNWNDSSGAIGSAIQTVLGGSSVNGSGDFPSYEIQFYGPFADIDVGQMGFGTNNLTNAVTISVSTIQNGSEPAIMIVHAPTGLTLTSKVFARGSDTLIETITLTERTNCKGMYEGDLTANESGWHDVSIFSGATCVGIQVAYLTTNAVEHYAGDYCGIEDPSGLLSTVGPSATSIRSAVGLASANLDTQLNATATTATAIKTKTDYLPSTASGASGGLVIGNGTGTITLTSGGLPKVVDASGANVATAASIPTLAGIASTVAATVPTNASIASTVASAITADHGSGAYTTADVSSLATTSQLAASSAALLTQVNLAIATSAAILDDTGTSGVVVAAIKAKTDNLPASPAATGDIPTLVGIASTVAANVPTNAQIAATVASVITADHGSGAYTTANVSSLATTAQLAASSATLLAAIPSISTLATTSQLAASSAALLTQVNLAIATSAAILDDTGTSGVVVAAESKTGYKLASDGLDTISTTAPTGVATNFREMFVQVWRRFFKKATLTSTQLKTYADDGTTVVTTQAVTNTGGTETIGNAS